MKHSKTYAKLERLHKRVCNVLRDQIFTLNLCPSNRSHTRTCSVRKMSRIYNTLGTPAEFFLLALTEKRQIIYYLYLSKLISPTSPPYFPCKTP